MLVNNNCETLASASYEWENQLVNGIWTYDLDLAWAVIQTCYAQIAADVGSRYHVPFQNIVAIVVSAMMHGYLPFDQAGKQLAGFRTWRNNITEQAADILTNVFSFNIPQRWSIAHLYQAILNEEAHVEHLDFLTTLAGYVN